VVERAVVGRSQSRLRFRNVISDAETRADGLLADQKFVVVVSNTEIEGRILEDSKTILNVRAQRAAGL
jgi:hypothetical protein